MADPEREIAELKDLAGVLGLQISTVSKVLEQWLEDPEGMSKKAPYKTVKLLTLDAVVKADSGGILERVARRISRTGPC